MARINQHRKQSISVARDALPAPLPQSTIVQKMDREKKRTKTIHSTDSPYPAPPWPVIASTDQQMMLELLCDLLAPLGEHRRNHIYRSQGKRSKRRRQGEEKYTVDKAVLSVPSMPPMPEVAQYITVGFNSTIRGLQDVAQPTSKPTPAVSQDGQLDHTKSMAVVFVCTSTLPEMLTISIPTTVAAASARHSSRPPIRLVSLPKEAEKRLAEALFQPRVGLVGLRQDTAGGRALIEMTMNKISPVDIPWLRPDVRVKYRPVSIKTSTSLSE
ncbi:hypothetical protein GJ744_001135 [Endocarpon pusillum]|uniref:Uncharacterized protein n=1 Tax=Endocarpon pusillum TaxID=364733 RepID=A0A8H7ADP8_9EURO|nr:hypothetical protein GJ744_001135 [Endocarpon pusillum]